MQYIFDDPDQELYDSVVGRESVYRCDYTGDEICPLVDALAGETRVIAHIPVSQELDDDIAEFPAQYLDELRDSFYQQVVSPATGST
ncbi:MAG: hypothetical protein ABEJ07_02210 [Candidatus Nanohaloarchaea archaeon]